MLENDHQTPVASAAVPSCQVKLPENWSDYFAPQGLVPTLPSYNRRFTRQYFRTQIFVRMLSNLPAFERPEEAVIVLGKDISRGGLGFLSHRQLFPGERGEIQAASRCLCFEVVRCRKKAENCYEVGAVTVSGDA